MTTLTDIFELESVSCIEPVFEDLSNTIYTSEACAAEVSACRLLIDEKEDPMAVAFLTPSGWIISSYLFRPFSGFLLEIAEKTGVEFYQHPAGDYLRALREYYSCALARETRPASEDNREGRDLMIESLICDNWGDLSGCSVFDCCCGSGVASSVIRKKGGEVCSCDNDAALISLGLHTRRLMPQECMCIDASSAALYTPPADYGLGLMLGDIAGFNAGIWESIIGNICAVSENSLFTTATEPEIRRIEGWCRSLGCTVEVHENDRDPIYDRWVCSAVF